LGQNFFKLNNLDLSEECFIIDEILLIAKMSDCEIIFTTSRDEMHSISYSPNFSKSIKSEKSNDMIHIKQKKNNNTLFYLTLTYYTDFYFFYEFGLNLMEEEAREIVQSCEEYKSVMHSNYFYATNQFHEIKKILTFAFEIVKNI